MKGDCPVKTKTTDYVLVERPVVVIKQLVKMFQSFFRMCSVNNDLAVIFLPTTGAVDRPLCQCTTVVLEWYAVRSLSETLQESPSS